MATENPKISVYVPPRIHVQLKEYMGDTGIKSMSSAVVKILEEKLPSHRGSVLDRIEWLERRVNALENE